MKVSKMVKTIKTNNNDWEYTQEKKAFKKQDKQFSQLKQGRNSGWSERVES